MSASNFEETISFHHQIVGESVTLFKTGLLAEQYFSS
jgi:hypothetical protein